MAASSSRQPHHDPPPSTPSKSSKSSRSTISRKGKGKENTAGEVQAELGDSSDPLLTDSLWDWTFLTDPSASKVPPIVTKDGNYFFSLVGSSVKIHSVITGEVVSTLSAPRSSTHEASSDHLTTAILNPHNAFQLITGSLDGRLVVWDFLDAALLQIIDISQPIHSICAHKAFKDIVFVAASKPGKKSKPGAVDDNVIVLRVSLQPVKNTTKSSEIIPIGKARVPSGLAVSSGGSWLVATANHKVYIASTSSLSNGFVKYVSPERLTCLAFHPSEEYFATGDEKGFIRLWYCLNGVLPVHVRGVEKKAQTTAFHWHAHAVSSLAFTTNGAYLLSGGEEAVLVIWQLHSGRKEFVPRVGAPISAIAVLQSQGGQEEYLLGLTDDTYLFVSSGNLKVLRSYSRIKLDPGTTYGLPSSSKHRSAPLAIHMSSSTLILPSSHPSSLQIYSPTSSKLVSELEVSPSNRVSRRDQKHIEPSYVDLIAVSSTGAWLATVDIREGDDSIRGEIYLKVWRWDTSSNHWVLNTRIDRPHGLERVTSLSFSPTHPPQLASTGKDGDTKTWGVRTIKKKGNTTEEFWVSRSSLSYRSQIPQSTSWSQDGSLLAVSFTRSITIYESATAIQRRSLTYPECGQIASVHFVGQASRYLVVVGPHQLILWDLVLQSARWTFSTASSIERVVPHKNTFSVFYGHSLDQEFQGTRISVFSPSSSQASTTSSVPFQLRNCLPYLLPTDKSSNLRFIGITEDWKVVLIGRDLKDVDAGNSSAREITLGSPSTKRTLFQDIFGKSAFTEVTNSPPTVTNASRGLRWDKEVADAFDRPAYLMPSMEHMFEPLMRRYLKPRPEEVVLHASTEDEDVEMEYDLQPVPIANKHIRVVKQEEMDAMIHLFRSIFQGSANVNNSGGTVGDIAPQPPPHMQHPPSTSPSKTVVNGNTPQTKLHSASIGLKNSLMPSLNGRKRKKSTS